MSRRIVRRETAFVACIGFAYLFEATHFRVSVLRQDWWWALDRHAFASYASDAVSGWSTSGIGSAVAYPTGYLAALALLFSAVVLTPPVAQAAYLFAVGTFSAIAALRFAGHADPFTRAAVALFGTFNPWVYTETVAGHFYMIVAYSATMLLFGELREPAPKPRRLAIAFLAIVQQVQFAFVPLAIYVVRFMRKRELLPLVTAAVVLLPAAIGVFANYGDLISMPYLLAWERQASVAPVDAIRLMGYFAGYGSHVAPVVGVAMIALAVAAAFGMFANVRRGVGSSGAAFAVLVASATLYATGSRGPVSALFELLVLGVPQSAVFRELYDLLAYTAMAYVGLGAAGSRSFFFARVLFVVGSCALAVTWLFDPPYAYTVDARSLPSMRIASAPSSRYALFPSFQPFSFDGRGSGLDPDAFALPGDRTPLDEFMPTYPAVTALARFAAFCDTSALAKLGVTFVAVRPWLHGFDPHAPLSDGSQCAVGPEIKGAMPMVGLGDAPLRGSFAGKPGAGNIFFGDRPQPSERVIPVVVDRRFASPADGWADARLAFSSDPAVGQPFGGAATSSGGALLRIVPGFPALVLVRGKLEDGSSRVLSTSTAERYRWIAIPTNANTVRCEGSCFVALQGTPPRNVPLDPPTRAVAPVPFRTLAPFAVLVSLEPGPARFLRFDAAYNRNWVAFSNVAAPLRHVRVDGVTNGWDLPPRSRNSTIVIINFAALLECAACLAATAYALGLATFAARRAIRAFIA